MKIVIVGIGKIGLTLTGVLSGEDNDVTLIDTNEKVIQSAINTYDVIGIAGNAVNISVQKEAGVEHADVLIATTYSDEINMLCCLIAKKLGVRRTIARIRDPEYSKQFIYTLDEMGLDMAVNPELESAGEILRLIRYPSAIGIDTFAKGKVDLAEMKIPSGSLLDGVAIKNLSRTLGNIRILVCAVQHGEDVYIPNGENVLYGGDRIYFTSSGPQLAEFCRKVGDTQKLKNVFIIGGGHISYYLAKQLIDHGYKVKIVEKDEKRCAELNESLPKAEIIHGDGTDHNLLQEENFRFADACVAATGIDEENIIISLYAKNTGVGKIITKVSKTTLTDMLETVGLDSVISPKQVCSDLILSYVRAMKNSTGNRVETLYKIVDDRVEALEFHISDKSNVINIPLRDLKLRNNILISCIIRDNTVIFPGGNDAILPNDNVIVTTIHTTLSDIDDILG